MVGDRNSDGAIVANCCGQHGEVRVRICKSLAAENIELPTMPWTSEHRAIQRALDQLGASMGAFAQERSQLPLNASHSHTMLANPHGQKFAFFEILKISRDDFHKVRPYPLQSPHECCCFFDAEHNIHVLNRLAGGSFDKIIGDRDDDNGSRTRIDTHADVAEICVGHCLDLG